MTLDKTAATALALIVGIGIGSLATALYLRETRAPATGDASDARAESRTLANDTNSAVASTSVAVAASGAPVRETGSMRQEISSPARMATKPSAPPPAFPGWTAYFETKY